MKQPAAGPVLLFARVSAAELHSGSGVVCTGFVGFFIGLTCTESFSYDNGFIARMYHNILTLQENKGTTDSLPCIPGIPRTSGFFVFFKLCIFSNT
ncbi:hypothetical protein GDO78_015106 [Eleutherodactylus coqui]|uniref:Uncharacterized protein n=1 Tax=Eleutherodactylus coqui TaxID=57060 RepID=A0A8J6JTB8_ELECQ|nr:hypothetical protein GDO78_015106 [Eleutherodactylus coqui]